VLFSLRRTPHEGGLKNVFARERQRDPARFRLLELVDVLANFRKHARGEAFGGRRTRLDMLLALSFDRAGQQEILTHPVVLEVGLRQGVDFAPQRCRLGWAFASRFSNSFFAGPKFSAICAR
jgi:hypothetical protein